MPTLPKTLLSALLAFFLPFSQLSAFDDDADAAMRSTSSI
jgi:hypothetical protein